MRTYLSIASVGLIVVAAAACTTKTSSSAGADEAVVSQPKSALVLQGKITAGETTPIAIVEQQGAEDTNVVDVDMSQTKLAGDEGLLLSSADFKSAVLWAKGTVVQHDTGHTVGHSKVLVDVLEASVVGRVDKDHVAGEGILRKEPGGSFLVEVKVGTPPDDDDAGSFEVDLSAMAPSAVAPLVDKKVHVEGLTLSKLDGAIQHKYLTTSELMIADKLEAAP